MVKSKPIQDYKTIGQACCYLFRKYPHIIIWVICIGICIQNGEEVISGGNTPLTFCEVIPQEGIESFVADARAQVAQEVRPVEIYNALIRIVVLTLVDRDVNVTVETVEKVWVKWSSKNVKGSVYYL